MATDRTSHPHYDAGFTGLIVPHPTFVSQGKDCIDLTESDSNAGADDLTQAGPRAGIAEPQDQTEMRVHSGGEQAANLTLHMETIRPGMPGFNPDLTPGGGFAWKYAADALWRGNDEPTIMSDFEVALVGTAGAATATPIGGLNAITLQDRTVLVAYGTTATNPTTTDGVRVRIRDPSAGTWSSVVVKSFGYVFSTGRGPQPALVELPSTTTDAGRVLCFYWVELQAGPDVGDIQLAMSSSDDSGATWTERVLAGLPAPIVYGAAGGGNSDYDLIGRMTVAYLNQEIALVCELRLADTTYGAGNSQDQLRQYASANLGASFAQIGESVGTSSDTFAGVRPTLTPSLGMLVLTWSRTLSDNAQVSRLGSAFEDFTTTTSAVIDATIDSSTHSGATVQTVDDAALSCCAADDGVLYLVARDHSGAVARECTTLRSVDGGVTWEGMGQSANRPSYSFWHTGMNVQVYPEDLAATWHEGRVVVAHHHVDAAGAGTYDPSIDVAYLGGPSTVTMPSYDKTNSAVAQTSWEVNYVPYSLPANVGWTGAGAGTVSQTGTATRLVTVANELNYRDVPVGSLAEGLAMEFAMDGVAGADHTQKEIFVLCQIGDGAASWTVEAWIGTTTVRLVDVGNASATIGDATVLDTSAGLTVRIEMWEESTGVLGGVRWWTRSGTARVSDREWVAQTGSAALVDNGALAFELRWGNDAGSTATSDWYRVSHTSDQWAGSTLDTAITNPDELHPRNWAPYPVHVDGGYTARADDGPTLNGDEWIASTRYDNEVYRLLPWVDASPRHQWQSTSETQHRIALQYTTLAKLSRSGNVLQAVAFVNANIRTGIIEERDAAGAWSTTTTFDAASTNLASMNYTRAGDAVYPAAGGSDTPYIHEGECIGWTVDLGSSKFRKVLYNTEGFWDSTGKGAVFWLEGMDDTEPASGTMALIPKDFVVMWRDNDPGYRGLRVVIDAQTTADGAFKIGNIVPGYAAIWACPPSWGRGVETSPNVEIIEAPDWTDTARKRSPERRMAEVAWADGCVTRQLFTGTEPDSLTSTTTGGAAEVATWQGTPYLVQGLMRALDGPKVPIVYIARIPKGPPDTPVINRRANILYGRLVGPTRLDTTMGTAQLDETVRIASKIIQELV